MRYNEYKKFQSDQFSKLPVMFAFSEKQLKEGMDKLGAKKSELISIGAGGFMKQSDGHLIVEFQTQSDAMKARLMKDDLFLVDMFRYELGNHEYCITYDLTDTLESLDLTEDKVNNDPKLKAALKQARSEYLDNCY